jgi:hypothetical protein
MTKTRSVSYWTTSVFSSTVTNFFHYYCLERRLSYEWIVLTLSLISRPTVSRPVCLGIKHPFGAYYQIFISLRHLRVCWYGALSLWREDGSVVCNNCWSSPAQSFSGPIPLGLATICYCLRFMTSLFVASYDSQGYGGGIRPRLHTEGNGNGPEGLIR